MTKALSNDLGAIGAALAAIPSGCSVLTTQRGAQSTGILVSWVQQASFQPPMVTVCIRSGRPVANLLGGEGRFLLNVVGEDPTALFRHFARGFELHEDAFAGLTIEATEFGPRIESAIAFLGCEIRQTLATGDHVLYAGEVRAAYAGAAAKPYTHIRKNGLNY